MREKECPWFMRLTMQNTQTGHQAFVMYPSDSYEIFDSMARCQIPYGAGDYSHLAVSYNGVNADSLQKALSGIIEHLAHPPSIQELNHLGFQIQSMNETERGEYEQSITAQEDISVVDAINTSYRILRQDAYYDGMAISGRAVLFGEDEPYLNLLLVDPCDDGLNFSENNGIFVSLPATEDELIAAAKSLGHSSYNDLVIGGVTGFLGIDEDALDGYTVNDFNRYAKALKDNGIVKELAKFKAIASMETCNDLHLVTELAYKLDEYEFHIGESLELIGGAFREQFPEWDDNAELAEHLGFESTMYGAVRPVEQHGLEQMLQL